jgi:hypothetical protein
MATSKDSVCVLACNGNHLFESCNLIVKKLVITFNGRVRPTTVERGISWPIV